MATETNEKRSEFTKEKQHLKKIVVPFGCWADKSTA